MSGIMPQALLETFQRNYLTLGAAFGILQVVIHHGLLRDSTQETYAAASYYLLNPFRG